MYSLLYDEQSFSLHNLYTFSPLWFNPHLRSMSSMLLHNELQYEIDITAPTTFLQISNVIAERFSPISPNNFTKSPTHFCQKSPNRSSPNRRTHLLQIANVFLHAFSPNHRTLCSKSPRFFTDQRAAYVLFCSLRRPPSF